MMKIRVFSWNYGDNTLEKEQKIKHYIASELEAASNDIDIFVIGLQEVHAKDAPRLGTSLKRYMYDLDYRGNIFQQTSKKFTLFTGIFMRPHLRYVDFEEKHLYLPQHQGLFWNLIKPITGTKGSLSIHLTLRNELTGFISKYIFVNVHLPFDSEILTKESIINVLKPFIWKDANIIMYGDFNSRSLFNDDCDKKNKKKCDGVNYEKNIDVHTVQGLQDHLNSCKRLQTGNGINTRALNCDNLESNLQSNDLIIRDNLINKGFDELPLYGLPSYKIDPDTGDYLLKKQDRNKVKGRLPGYADRIIFSGSELTAINYKVLPYTGNDHFPVALSLFYTTTESNA
jgi:hypothetical protein